MATPLRSSSSNVTVEYTDPSGLFSSIKSLLSDILPLRNLHWKSPTRPLRSIDSLHIDFVPAQSAEQEQKRLSDGAVSHRRHQIPGLRQTPYLKIYLLRCDDNETYKSTSRKLVREWIKTRTSPPQSSSSTNKPDNHDAFEWLIIHVAPNAAGSEAVEKSGTTSKWPGRGSTSVLEKVKADFNGSSKSSVDRVAQIRIPKPDLPKRPPELAAQLEDLVTKLKSSILTSFDLRVAQYEEDIREKDSQRSLPGWNFCTFFILKEGLARGFEHVGLFEDALVGYDELSVGLDATLRDQLAGVGDQHGGTFLNFSEDVKMKAEGALQSLSQSDSEGATEDGDSSHDDEIDEHDDSESSSPAVSLAPELFPLDANKKPYRDMILANNISVFDFRAYIFSRQMLLLLKAAGAPSVQSESSKHRQTNDKQTHKVEDLTLLAEVCERASEFISIGSRILRRDLENAVGQLEHDQDESTLKELVNNIVCSWAYAAVSQVLVQTATESLDLPQASLRRSRDLVDASVIASLVADTRPGVPKRSSSLLAAPQPNSRPTSQEIFASGMQPGGQPKASLSSLKPDKPESQRTGASELASARGDLFLFARCTLEKIGRCRGWCERWGEMSLLYDESTPVMTDMKDISLNGDSDMEQEQPGDEKNPTVALTNGIDTPTLISSTRSQKRFDLLYEKLTDQIFRHYVTANRTRSAEMAMGDIAFLRYRSGDYAFAAPYFHHLVSFYGSTRWNTLEGAMLELYGRCLKHLDRKDEYVRVLLRLLGNCASASWSGVRLKAPRANRLSSAAPSSFTSATKMAISSYVDDLFNVSVSLPKAVSAPLSYFFSGFDISPMIRHFEDRDGFQLQLSLRYLLGQNIKIEDVKVRLVSAFNSQNELWLGRSDEIVVKSTPTKILLESYVSVSGKYLVDRIELQAGNIKFSQDSGRHSSLPPGFREGEADDSAEEDDRPIVLCYPRAKGLDARIISPYHIDLGDSRTIEVELRSGCNDILKGVLRVKPGTAGLRLRIADAKIVDGYIETIQDADSGHIDFRNFGPGSFARLSIPYSLEGSQSSLSSKLEVDYETSEGRFSYTSSTSIPSALPVSVNVQDIFKEDVLFSRFTISPTTMTPLRILNCEIPSSNIYEVGPSIPKGEVLDVFPKQPASLLYKISPQEADKQEGQERSLRLSINFTCLDQECLSVIENQFTTDITESKFECLTRLLVQHLLGTFRSQWTAGDLETIGLLREIQIFAFERMQWETVTKSLGQSLEKEVTAWLVAWHNAHHIFPLPETVSSNSLRQIIIPVDVPDVQVVHTAELSLPSASGSHIYAVGEMIPATLTVRHTRRWCPVKAQEPGSELEFSYEILANPDLWLIGGRRRGHYAAKEGEMSSFTVMLLPQRAGHLILPGLEVKTFAIQAPLQSGLLSTPQRRPIPNELDYRNLGETVLVTPDLRKTTISLDPSGSPGGGSWLVESERRVKVPT
ncbi:hypothetical protein AJ80_08444 [Polytolypa hystricis UAMH7299]|uniref:Trafficking protein particle complex subunit 10 n=1 Tax=Polytolypa hystricis (strain UAMH7299) TaxID=1447883 RepID=A0A2B7X7F1_POLH7|nr:hypothetical protein AJ80_08444 [Polytolypa hystricis UAMH7299]